MDQKPLFPAKGNFRIVKITDADAKYVTDDLQLTRKRIQESEEAYPNIGKWFDAKVISGLRDKSRFAYVGLLDNQPIVAAIAKKGRNAKICHLKIDDEIQDKHIGELFFSLIALRLRSSSSKIHFTLPESLWSEKQKFFESFGFSSVTAAKKQYRLFDEELYSTASTKDVIANVHRKMSAWDDEYLISGRSMLPSLVMSMKPKYADLIMKKKKTVEIRRSFSRKWSGKTVALYAGSPIRSIVGEVEIRQIVEGTAESLSKHFGPMIGASSYEVRRYLEGKKTGFAIILENPKQYRDPVPLEQLSSLLSQSFSPPQSYLSVGNSSHWRKAVLLAGLLQDA